MTASPVPGTAPDPASAQPLRVNEIFLSIQGESTHTGLPTVFIRLTGCPLRCGYCDTEYAFHEGTRVALADVLERVAAFATKHVTVTGGEPLAQPNCLALLRALCDAGLDVSLETSGALDISGVDERVCTVMDLKTPGSGECERNRMENLERLRPTDQIKFVICDRADYEWALAAIKAHALAGRCELLFSPCHGRLDAAELAQWILDDRAPVRLQIQLHKYLWGDARGR